MVMAPVLGIFGYVAADRYAASKSPATPTPTPAKKAANAITQIQDYGRCGDMRTPCVLQQGDLRLELTLQRTADGYANITLRSSHAINGAVMSLWRELVDEQPTRLVPSVERNSWQTQISLINHVGDLPPPGLMEYKLRLVIQDDQSLYAEFSTLL